MSQICPPSVSTITASYSQVTSEKSMRAEGLMQHPCAPQGVPPAECGSRFSYSAVFMLECRSNMDFFVARNVLKNTLLAFSGSWVTRKSKGSGSSKPWIISYKYACYHQASVLSLSTRCWLSNLCTKMFTDLRGCSCEMFSDYSITSWIIGPMSE